jgi:peptide/nickel transport system ATP-binding protein
MTAQQDNGWDAVLNVKDLRVHYATPTGDVIACNGVNFQVYHGETLGLVGESGCGKTTAAMAILRRVRWHQVSLIPQGAMNSLNPVMRVKDQIADGIQTHEGRRPRRELKERILQLLNRVGLPGRVYHMYPHELSGGMKQRVCIAMAIALHPSLVIADEPTSALDVVVQRVVAQTLLDVKEELNMSMIMIGHDMGLQAQLVDRIAVMYAGNIMEIAPVEDIFAKPQHPYTQLLIDAIPSIKERKPLKVTEGLTHDLRDPPPGCVFHPRCTSPRATARCHEEVPVLHEVAPRHYVACRQD